MQRTQLPRPSTNVIGVHSLILILQRINSTFSFPAIMTSHQYEVALFAEFFSKDLQPILNRITLHCESAEPMHSREVVFEPLDAHRQRDQAQEPTLLRARKEFIVNGKNVDAPWCGALVHATLRLINPSRPRYLYSYLKPESVRVHPEATVRPWATVQVEGDAIGFAAALGYSCVLLLRSILCISLTRSFLQ